MQKGKILISVVNFNGSEDTIELLKSLEKNNYKKYDVFIWDNHSKKRERDKLRDYVKNKNKLFTFFSGQNIGLVGGGNKAIEYAIDKDYEYVLFMNNDMVVQEDFIKLLLNEISLDKKIAAAGPSILYSEDVETIWSGEIKFTPYRFKNFLEGRKITEIDSKPRRVEALDCVFLVRVKVLREVGGLPMEFFIMHEYTGWCLKARKKGYYIIYVPESKVWHKVGRSTNKHPKLIQYFGSRNWILILRKYASKGEIILGVGFHIIFGIPRKLRSLINKGNFSLYSYYSGAINGLILKQK
jgi:GT2 family glycosyltransferase